jgi:hypothetical protein
MQIYCDSIQPWVKLGGELQSFSEDARLTAVAAALSAAARFSSDDLVGVAEPRYQRDGPAV